MCGEADVGTGDREVVPQRYPGYSLGGEKRSQSKHNWIELKIIWEQRDLSGCHLKPTSDPGKELIQMIHTYNSMKLLNLVDKDRII